MEVIVNKKALVQAIIESIVEEEQEIEFQRISMEDNEPIQPIEMMSTQLAEEMPPVEDPEFVPVSLEELGRSAYVISQEVPQSQIEYFYRKLHKLLDLALDREAEQGLQVESVRGIISSLLNEADNMESMLLQRAVERLESEDSYSIAMEYIESYDEFEGMDPGDLSARIESLAYGIDDTQEEEYETDESTEEDTEAPDEKVEIETGQEDDLDYSDEEYDYDLDKPGRSGEELAKEIVQLIIQRDLHTTVLNDPETGEPEMVPVVIIDPDTGDFKLSEKEMRVLASEEYGFEIIRRALDMKNIRSLFDKLAKRGGDKKAWMWVYSNLNGILGKEGVPVSSDLAAEMYANQIADTIGKYGEAVRDQLIEMADQVESKTDDITAQIGRGSDSLSIVVPPYEMAEALRLVADQRLDPPKRGRPKIYGDEEEQEPMTPEMRKQIRAERRKAELDLQFEPGRLHLSAKALRAMMDDIAEKLGVSLGNVRNVIYDDLKVYGLPAEDLRKIIQVDKLPGGREKIPFTYDPLRIKAQEEIVEGLYELYTDSMKKYLKSIIDTGTDFEDGGGEKELAIQYLDLMFGKDGVYKPGLDGYINLQSQVGGPTVDDPDSVNMDDAGWKIKRNAYDFIQEFIDQIAKGWVSPSEYKPAKEGGMRAILASLVNDEIFSDLNSRSAVDEYIESEIRGINNQFKIADDTGKETNEKLFDILDKVFDRAPRRTKKYIKRVNKELGVS